MRFLYVFSGALYFLQGVGKEKMYFILYLLLRYNFI